MSRKGNCYDNAAMESFYGKYKLSTVRGIQFAGEEEARTNAFEYIEVFYNRFRKHSSLGYKSPVQFEAMASESQTGSQPLQSACITNN
jgi:putative transposase